MNYQICSQCVMDTSDEDITFDAQGVCCHCQSCEATLRDRLIKGEQGRRKWELLVEQIKKEGRKRRYDCVIGLSGGVDSSFLVLEVARAGLRPLVVHVDAGWNSELAVGNIEVVLNATGFDLETLVVDWPAMRELQLAYLRSGVLALDMPQDHCFIAGVRQFAREYGLRYNLTGSNLSTESILPRNWTWSPLDLRNMRDIADSFGTGLDPRFPVVTTRDLYRDRVRGFRSLSPLDLLDYDKEEAVASLTRCGWRSYPRKHGESRFTAFFQDYVLPHRWSIDKRRAHLSSLVLSGQVSRTEALKVLTQPVFSSAEIALEVDFIARKMEISTDELQSILAGARRGHQEFKHGHNRAFAAITGLGRRVIPSASRV